MEVVINNQVYPVIITRKSIKNMYLRFKDNSIYISANKYISERQIGDFINDNQSQIIKLSNRHQLKTAKANAFYFLGQAYEVVINESIKAVIQEGDTLYVKTAAMLDQWLKQAMIDIFSKRLEICYNKFNSSVPYPTLKYRKMTTRWGVCHRINKSITLNTELIKYDISVIDYVIIHELCHFIHPHHQSAFWELVAVYAPDYKLLRKKLKE